MYRSILTIALLFISFSIISQRINAPNSNAALLTVGNEPIGTGFFVVRNNMLYLVTARHVFYEKDSLSHSIKYNLKHAKVEMITYDGLSTELRKSVSMIDLSQAFESGRIKFHLWKDVCLVELGAIEFKSESRATFSAAKFFNREMGAGLSGFFDADILKLNQVTLGSDAIMYGYPTYLEIEGLTDNIYEFDKLLIRKGVIAGISQKFQNIIIDGASFYGNSGSPVIEVVPSFEVDGEYLTYKTDHKLIGLVSSFIPFVFEDNISTSVPPNLDISNSGYSVVVPAEFILELIDNL